MGGPHFEPTEIRERGVVLLTKFEHIYDEQKRNKIFKKEKKTLAAIFARLEEDKERVAAGLIESAAWQRVMLTELVEIIRRDGYVEQYQNGENQGGLKKSAACEVYDKTLNTYSKVIKQLCELLPQEQAGVPGMEIMDFIRR